MSDYVVDAGAIIAALGAKTDLGIATHQLITESTCHAPHLLDAEVGHALRRRERAGQISAETAQTALAGLSTLIDHRYQHTGPIATLAWRIRHTITFYDGLYVALATMLDLPLLTADVKLSKAPDLSCMVQLIR